MAARASPLIRFALDEEQAIGSLLEERGAELARRGFEAQVPTREASLAFFHPAGPAGPRFRPERAGDAFCTPLGRVSLADLRARLADDPLSFSTSALLRPLVQDTLLPTAAYLGGPAECTYFAQLPPLYGSPAWSSPLIAPRARFRVVDPWTAGVLERLGLAPEDTDQSVQALAAQLHAWPEWMDGALRERLLGPLEQELETSAPRGSGARPGLARNVEKTRAHVARGVDRFIARLQRAVLTSRGVGTSALASLEQVLAALHPAGQLPGAGARVLGGGRRGGTAGADLQPGGGRGAALTRGPDGAPVNALVGGNRLLPDRGRKRRCRLAAGDAAGDARPPGPRLLLGSPGAAGR